MRLTADPREVAAGGIWLARRLQETYPATREAFAAGLLRIEQVRVIVKAAERAPAGVTARAARRLRRQGWWPRPPVPGPGRVGR